MPKIKTSELTGPALDWAVAKCEGGTDFFFDGITWGFTLDGQSKVLATGWAPGMSYSPSTDWAQGGPIIERERIELNTAPKGNWAANTSVEGCMEYGPTPLIAAMRCYCASKLGDKVAVPEELV